ncbi:MAG: response regulator, partial [Candidatus Omnitrophica bacterium]|nr:response regulator [Candidatus Omnitrophota bacterium]
MKNRGGDSKMSARKILVGETDATFIKQLKMRLRDKDYEIITVEDGQAVINKVHEDKPDLIIMNVSLPITSGYQVCTNLKHDFK